MKLGWPEKIRGVPVGEVLQKEMKELQQELNLHQYNFPFK